MSARIVTKCELCGRYLRPVLSLGSSPPTCVMPLVGEPRATEEHHPLELLYCDTCTHAQLSVVVDPEVVFPPDYPYQSGNSKALHENFEDLAEEATARVGLKPVDLVVDIGANDGTLLSKFEGCRTIGVEPTGQARKIQGEVYQAFFDSDLADFLRNAYGKAKVITACNVLAHVRDVNDVMLGISELLADDGVLVAENHNLRSISDDGQWDTIYHEHLRVFSPYSFQQLLDRHGLTVQSCMEIATHGGSFRTVAGRGGSNGRFFHHEYDFEPVARQAQMVRRALRRNGPFWGVGATARATTIINYCGLDVEDVPCVCEVAGSDKIGHYIPGTRIPVVDEARLLEEQPKNVLLFSWHLADHIAPKLREKGYQGNILAPLPALRHV